MGEVSMAAVRNDVLYIAAAVLRRSATSLAIDLPLTDRRNGADEAAAGEIAMAVEDWFDVGLEEEDAPPSITRLCQQVAKSLNEQGRQPPSGAERDEAKARFDATCREPEDDGERIIGFGGKRRRPE